MKKILFGLLLALAIPISAQNTKKISALPQATEMEPESVVPVVQNGTTYKMDKTTMQKTLRDSLVDAYTQINLLWDMIGKGGQPDAVLQVFYKFEESATDETGYGRDFLAASDFYYVDIDTWVGGFDTITRRVRCPEFDQTAYFITTFDAFVYNDSSGNRTMVAGDGWRVLINGTDISFVTTGGTTTASDAFTIDTVQYRSIHIAVESDGSIWVDGVEQTVSGSITPGFDSNGDIYIGCTQAATESFYGYIDNFKLYTGTMDAADLVNENKSSEYYSPADITSPVINSAVVDIPNSIVLRFSESVYGFDETALISALTYTANGADVSIDSASYYSSGYNISIYTDSVASGASLKLSYDTTGTGYAGLTDWAGNNLNTIFQRTVTNNYVLPVTDIIQIRYPFDGNGTDVVSGRNTVDTTVTYSSSIFAEGTQSMLINGDTYRSWIPSSYDDNPDTLCFKAEVRLLANVANYDLIQNYSATPFRIEWRAAGNDIYVYGGGTYAAATNIGGSSSATPTGEWRTLIVTYVKSSGNVTINVDGVDETDAQGAASSADLSGPYKFGKRFYIDDVQIYHISPTPDEINTLQTPGNVLQRQQSPPAPPVPVNDVIDTLFYFDFEDSDLGYYDRTQFTNDFNAETSTSSAWTYTGYTSSTRPEIVSESVYIDGVLGTTRRLRLTDVANTTVSTQTPMNARCVPFGRDENNTDVYLRYDVYTPYSSWRYVRDANATDTPAGKFPGFWTNYQVRFNKADVMGDRVRWRGGSSSVHYYTGYFGDEVEVLAQWYDPETGGILQVPHGSTTDSVHRITIRLVTGPNGFAEYFYNGVLVGTQYDHGYDLTGHLVDTFMFGYFMNNDRTIDHNVRTDFDNILIYRYDPDYSEGYWMQHSPPGRTLYDPLPTYR